MAEAPVQAPVLSNAELGKLANRVAVHGAESKAAYAAVPPEKRAVVTRAGENVAANEGSDALLTLASEFKHVGDATTIIEKTVYNGVGPDGKRVPTPGSQEQRRAKGLIMQKDIAVKLLAGTPALTTAEKTYIHNALTKIISRNPQLLKAYGVPPAAAPKPALLDQLMHSGDYIAALTTDMNAAFDQAKDGHLEMAKIDTELHEITLKRITKQRQLDAETAKKTRLDDAGKDLTKFNTKTEAAYGGQTKQAALTTAGTRLNVGAGVTPETQSYLADMGTLKLMETQLANGTVAAADLANHNATINTLKNNIATAESNGDPQIKAAIDTIRTLNNEMSDIQARIAERANPARMAEINANIQGFGDELNMLIMTEQDKIVERQQITTDFEAGLMQAFSHAAAETIDKRVNTFKEAYPQYEQAAKTAMEGELKQKIYDHIQTRWNMERKSRIPFSSKTKVIVDFDLARQDLDTMLDIAPDKGVNALIREVLVDSYGATASHPLTAEQSHTIDQMMKDPAFMEEQRNYILPRALVAYSQGGGVITEDRMRTIAMTDWGAGALDAMFDKNKEIKQILNKNIASGYASRDILNSLGGPTRLLMMFLMAIGILPQGTLRGPKNG